MISFNTINHLYKITHIQFILIDNDIIIPFFLTIKCIFDKYYLFMQHLRIVLILILLYLCGDSFAQTKVYSQQEITKLNDKASRFKEC
jgi:hypothetical protein